MLRRILKQKRYFKNIYKEQHGITGLETAIILIAFVVVAAVFAYTVLSAGLFSTQKSQEAVYNGLQETQNTLEVKGAVLSQADAKAKDACDALGNWTAGTNASRLLETTTIEEGSGSISCSVTNAVSENETVLSAHNWGTPTVATGDTVTFWAKISSNLVGKLGFAVGANAGAITASSLTDVAFSATDTNWHNYAVTVDVSNDTNAYYGVYWIGAAAAGTETFYIDDVEINNVSLWQSTYSWTPHSSDIIIVLALPTGGQSVDFSPGDDTDSNGLFDDANKTNKLVVNYNDRAQHFADVAWTGDFIGNNNSDYMLDPGEKIRLTISLAAINAGSEQVDANHQFTLELKTPKGPILSLQRTMPARLYGIDNLN
jgi:flagellin-like protein